MELILSNIPPLRFPNKEILSLFEDLFNASNGVLIATGYVSADALAELKKIIEINKKKHLKLVIGMHGFEGFTKPQYDAAMYLDKYLRDAGIGSVDVATTFKFHGKLYCFLSNKNPIAGLVGSSNLSSIFDARNIYEADLLVHDRKIIHEIYDFITALSQKACTPIKDLKVTKFKESQSNLLEGHEGAERASKEEVEKALSKRTKTIFKIPIKSDDAPQSNLNAFFGKGRKNKKGFIKPRHWYEVELIVPKYITEDPEYPKAGYPESESIIDIVTDDGWKFKCKISGQNSKNFRSADDLKILGRWIKGRLENSGVLKVGEPVTREVLGAYGRSDFDLIATSDPGTWILNFGV